jgi:hypothetical protein
MNQQARANAAQSVTLCSFVSFVVTLSFLLGCAGAPKNPGWSNAAGAEQHERLMWQAIREHDWANFERHLAPIFVGVNSSGQLLDRDQWVAYWKNTPLKDFSLGEVTVEPQGPDMIVTYVFHSDRDAWRVVSVWQGVKKGWTLTTSSITPLAPMQSPA